MAQIPPRTRQIEDRDDDESEQAGGGRHDFALENEEEQRLGQIEEWIMLADRRLERLDAKIDRLGAVIDQLNTQLGTVLADLPTRRGINLYLVGGLIGGLAVGLAIMGITIGGFVGGLASLRPEAAPASAPAYNYPPPSQAPIIIQVPSGSITGTVPAPQPVAAPPAPAK
ncbi:MAG: hypothetical protein WCF85_16780 [Rhodospirillaceae bacterium]